MSQIDHQVAIVSFEGAIKREVKRIREKLKPLAEKLTKNELKITIEASGRILDGDIKIEYQISLCKYGTGTVKASDMTAAVDELMRREGWQAVNAPLALYNEIPF